MGYFLFACFHKLNTGKVTDDSTPLQYHFLHKNKTSVVFHRQCTCPVHSAVCNLQFDLKTVKTNTKK